MMSSSIGRQQAAERLELFPGQLAEAVSGLSDEQLDTRYREGGWTVRQVVHHLADAHVNGYVRIKLALTEGFPVLRTYQQERWAELPDAALPIEPSLELLRALHERWAALVSSLDEVSLARRAYHPENGDMRVAELLEVYLRHCDNHLAQILDLKRRAGW